LNYKYLLLEEASAEAGAAPTGGTLDIKTPTAEGGAETKLGAIKRKSLNRTHVKLTKSRGLNPPPVRWIGF
jgi:hypothetical protein